MGTRSFIGIQKDKTVLGIYCHYDGYPSNNGRILLEHYSDSEKINKLISLGDISYLAPNLAPSQGESHYFENPVEGVVVAYGRDRGESDVFAKQYSMTNLPNFYDYFYIYTEEGWIFSDNGIDYQNLTSEICS
jgi:hypothetical protein